MTAKRLADLSVEYLVKEDGQRMGVVLRWEDFLALQAMLPADPDLLAGLSEPELTVLADGMLSSRYQTRLDVLLQRNRNDELSPAEEQELSALLEHVDYMDLLKARARIDAGSTKKRTRVTVMSVVIPASMRIWVQDQDRGRCAYCLSPEELSTAKFEVDHIVPVSAGGVTERTDLCLCCPTCNRHKGSSQIAVDPEAGTLVSLYHPRRQEWSEHFEWSADRSEIVGLTPTGRATVAALKMNRPQIVHLRRLWAKLGYSPWVA